MVAGASHGTWTLVSVSLELLSASAALCYRQSVAPRNHVTSVSTRRGCFCVGWCQLSHTHWYTHTVTHTHTHTQNRTHAHGIYTDSDNTTTRHKWQFVHRTDTHSRRYSSHTLGGPAAYTFLNIKRCAVFVSVYVSLCVCCCCCCFCCSFSGETDVIKITLICKAPWRARLRWGAI